VAGRARPQSSEDLPLVMFALTVFSLVLSPLQNAISRLYERQCDRYALQRTKNPAAYRSAFWKLARVNKAATRRSANGWRWRMWRRTRRIAPSRRFHLFFLRHQKNAGRSLCVRWAGNVVA